MGGLGSGRRATPAAAQVTEAFRSVDIREWERRGFLIPETSFCWGWFKCGTTVAAIRVRCEKHRLVFSGVSSVPGRLPQTLVHDVPLVMTPCHFGGHRLWFVCPVLGCHRRVALLYGGRTFACRYCRGLSYPSQRESPERRTMRRLNRVRERLGWSPGLDDPEKGKPRSMHTQTFIRLVELHNEEAIRVADRFSRAARAVQRDLAKLSWEA